jgi:hypothetical protein
MSSINWINKGTGPGVNDTDSFNALFGANATTARNIVQRAIDDWEDVIVDFNGSGGRNTYDLTVNAGSLAAGTFAATSGISYDASDKPDSATITIDPNNTTWYFDPAIGTSNVPDDSEFNTLVTPFAADDMALSGRDLYRSTLHELGHCMGLSATATRVTSLEVDGGDDPNSTNAADRLKFLDTNGDNFADYTLTTDGGRHLFEGALFFVGPTHPDELLVAGRAVSSSVLRRTLISDKLAQFYGDVFDYDIALPSNINTFYVNLNTAANSVTVHGDVNPNGDVDDNIDLEVTGSSMRFEVNGTQEIIAGAEFGSIIVNAGDGQDDIDVDQVLTGKTVSVNGQDGNDRIDIAQQFGDVDNDVLSDVTLNGGIGTDTVSVHDTNDTSAVDDYRVTSPAVETGIRTINHSLMERVVILGSDLGSVYHINSFAPFSTLDITAGPGTDSFYIGDDDFDSHIFGDVEIDGGGGLNEINLEDRNDTGAGSYTVTSDSFAKTAGGDVSFTDIDNFYLDASDQGSLFNVDLFNNDMDAYVFAADGNDTLDVDGATNDLDDGLRGFLQFYGEDGSDRLELDDTGDANNPDSYELTFMSFSKSSSPGELQYTSIESIDLRGNGGVNTMTVQLGSFAQGMSVTVGGGGGDDTITNFVGGLVSLLQGNVTLQGGTGTDTIILDDTAGSIADKYTLTSNTLQIKSPAATSGLITYATETLDLTTSDITSTIAIESTEAGTSYLIHAQDGNDTFEIGGPALDVSSIQGPVSVFGQAGADRINYNDDNNTLSSSYTLSKASLFRTGTANIDPDGIETAVVNAGDGADTVTVSQTFASAIMSVKGNGGDDTFIVADGVWDGAIQDGVDATGGAGTDTILINDSNDTGLDNYTVDSDVTTKSTGGGAIHYHTMEEYRLDGNVDANIITVNSTFDGDFRIRGNGGDDQIDVIDNFAGRYVRVDGNAGLDIVRVNTDAAGTANVEFNTTQDLSLLRVYNGGNARVNAGGDKVLVTNNLQIDAGGSLDMTDEDLIVDYTGLTPLGSIKALLTSGFAGGTWDGPGIESSTANANAAHTTALGYGESVNVLGSVGGTFSGINVDNTAILVKYTYYGDADLTGAVDVADLGALASNWQGLGRNWAQGNFDYDASSRVNVNDLGLLATNWQAGVGSPLAPARAARSQPFASLVNDLLT